MATVDDIIKWIKERGEEAQLVISFDPEHGDRWVAGMTVGMEAEDSDMAGGAAYGMGETPEEALSTVVADFRIPVAEEAR
jgi:hypothetical protein